MSGSNPYGSAPTHHMLSVLVQNRPGVLARVASLFARRGYNIFSLAVAPTEQAEYSRITIVVDVESSPLEQIVKQLLKWDKAYGVSVFDVQVDRLNVSFEKLPEDTRKLAKDIATLCPDVVEQGFASLGEALEHFAERAEPIPDDLAALCAGLDPAARDFPILALQRSLQLNRSVALWWD